MREKFNRLECERIGKWQTFIYIDFTDLLKKENECFEDLGGVFLGMDKWFGSKQFKKEYELEPLDSFHCSLSKTFELYKHQIDPIREKLTTLFRSYKSENFKLYFDVKASPQILLTEPKDIDNYAFVTYKIFDEKDVLKNLTANINEILASFDLPPYFDEPIFHVSFFRSHLRKADIMYYAEETKSELNEISKRLFPKLAEILDNIEPECLPFKMKCGDKEFLFE